MLIFKDIRKGELMETEQDEERIHSKMIYKIMEEKAKLLVGQKSCVEE